ncbi:MAG TPA: two-component regulator propeller domain-containing protein, partial [Saprospiraceae bacterium]|nr:two-component regulator propeller domain-containing protein [Saprospiraceae bacterium]
MHTDLLTIEAESGSTRDPDALSISYTCNHMLYDNFRRAGELLICFLLCNCYTYSQSPVYKNYTVNDGLPSQVVYCALQDKEGYMWFGTDAGVSRFNGKRFENFTIKDGLSDNEILNMFQDSRGRIWFYTINGKLSYYFNHKFYNETNDSILSKITAKYEFMSFMEDSNGNLWLGGFGRQMVLIEKEGKISNFDFNRLNEGYRRLWIQPFEASSDEIYFFTPQEVFQFKNGKISFKDTSNFLNPLNVKFHIYGFNSNVLYYMYNDQIYKFCNDSIQMLIGQETLRNYNEAKGIFVDRNQGIWIFTKEDEIVCFAKKDKQYQFGKTYLSGIEIGEIFVDSENNIWFCSIGNGVFMDMYANSSMNTPIIEFIKQTKNTTCLSIDKFDRVWFGGFNGTLNYLENDRVHSFRIPDSIKIRGISFDDKNNLWCVINGGVRYVEKGDVKDQDIVLNSVNLEYLPGKWEDYFGAKQLAIDRNGQIFVSINSGMAKLVQYFDKNYLSYWSSDSVFTKRIYCMYFDYENSLWFENSEKLYCLKPDGKLLSFPQYSQKFLSQINDIRGTSDSSLVIATYGNGIQFFRDGKII